MFSCEYSEVFKTNSFYRTHPVAVSEFKNYCLCLKELQNYNRKLLLCPPQNRRKDDQHFELLLLMINLHFGTSNLLSTYKKTSLLLKSKIHLVLSFLKIQRRLIQNKYTASFVTLSEKKRLTNLQKYQLQENFFSSAYVTDTTFFDKCFLFHVITGGHYLLKKFIVTLRSFQPPLSCAL